MRTMYGSILAAAMAVGGVGLANAAAGDGSCRQGCQEGVRERIERVSRGLGFDGRITSVAETNGIYDVIYEYVTGSNGLVRCELALPPADKWNGWFKGVGNVGAAGSLKADWVLGPAARGIAAAMTDMGSSDGRCTLNPVAIRDFGHRATHLMTVGAKQLVEAYYGRKPSYCFFEGISSGGGQGIHEAQRYPADYDGIVAGVPANRRLAIAAYFRHVYRLTHDESGKLLFSPEQAAALSDAGVEYFKGGDEPYCDGRFLSEPRYTTEAAKGVVELAVLKCPSLDTPDMRRRAEALFADVVVDGKRVCGGLPFGAKLQTILGRESFVMNWHKGRRWDFMRDTDAEFAAACAELAPDLNADNPDLSAFAARGGRIIMYSGIEDPIVPWHHGLEYYESVARKMGGYDEVQKFFAYYPMPGRAHTPDDWRGFGGRGVWTLDGLEEALHDWVKDGRFPGALQGRFADGVTTVPVQPYPLKTTGSAPSGWGVGRYGVRSDLVEMREKIEKEHTVKTVDKFYGFDRIVFDFDGHDAWVVCPKGESRPGKPWTWTMQWATAFVPRTNVPQMLNDGFHHVTIDTFRHRMDEEGLLVSAEFQKFLVEELGFAPKAYLIGMSWGGFFSTRYAVNCPQNVAKIYLDAPLLCFKDFNKDIGPWTVKMPEGGWAASPEMPLNMAERLAATKIPVLLLYGGVDAVVPPARNCEPFAERFKAAGGDITVVKRGLYAHHPHGVEVDETTIRDFFYGVGQSSCARPVPGPQLAAAMAVGALAADESKTEKGKCERGDVVSVSLRRGKTVETCEVKVAVRDNGMSLVIPRTELEGVDSLSVVPDFAHARTGEEGFFALADGMVGDFTATSGEYRLGSPPMTFWGMKTPRRTFVCEVTGMELSHGVCVTVTNGEYTVATEFSFGDETPYEDVSLDWTFLPDSAGYPDMAKVYRSHQLASGRVKTIRERLAAQPDLAYISTSVEIRVRQAWKPAPSPVLEQNASNEPQMKVAMTFDRTLEFVEACAEAGIGPAEFCLVGWNYRGHDGRYSQLWPVEPQLGGEDGLRHLISATQAKGFRIVLHNNHTDAYSVGEGFDLSDIAKKKDGMPVSNKGSKYVWSGGTSYTMCPRRAWERFVMDDLAKIAALGAHGLHYIDVLTIGRPAVCHDTRHPCTRRDSARYIGRMLALARKLMGGSASEGPYDFCAGDYDFCLYASYADPAGRKLPPLVTRTVPMWQLVYHGIILSMPFAGCTNYTIKPGSARLAMVEYGGRPVFYLYSNFMDGMQWMGNEDLRVGSPAELADAVAKIKKGADEFSQVADLQFELMEDHRLLAPGVALTSYANGAGTVVNRSDRPFFHKGVCIPSGDWRRF